MGPRVVPGLGIWLCPITARASSVRLRRHSGCTLRSEHWIHPALWQANLGTGLSLLTCFLPRQRLQAER